MTCAIGEETGGSILKPARFASTVGLPPTRELISAKGMIQPGISTRVGPICRTVKMRREYWTFTPGSIRRMELTAFSVGRLPRSLHVPAYAKATRLDGIRISVLRDTLDKDLFTIADI